MNELFDGIWACTIEWLVDGRWQAQVTPSESCEPSEWGEGETPEDAMRAAIATLC